MLLEIHICFIPFDPLLPKVHTFHPISVRNKNLTSLLESWFRSPQPHPEEACAFVFWAWTPGCMRPWWSRPMLDPGICQWVTALRTSALWVIFLNNICLRREAYESVWSWNFASFPPSCPFDNLLRDTVTLIFLMLPLSNTYKKFWFQIFWNQTESFYIHLPFIFLRERVMGKVFLPSSNSVHFSDVLR